MKLPEAGRINYAYGLTEILVI